MELRDGGLCRAAARRRVGQVEKGLGTATASNEASKRGATKERKQRYRVKIRTVDTANSANGRGQAGRAAAVLPSAKRRTPKISRSPVAAGAAAHYAPATRP